MAGRSIGLALPRVESRFAAAAAHEPLSALSVGARAELAAVLAAGGGFEDLPGKWQAALLAAEARAAGATSAPRACCGDA